MYGHPLSLAALHEHVGNTARGLTIQNARDLLRDAGFGAEVTKTGHDNADFSPALAIWQNGNFVVLGKQQKLTRDIFDPLRGWYTVTNQAIAANCNDFCIRITEVPVVPLIRVRVPFPWKAWLRSFDLKRLALPVAAVAIISQAVGIGLPVVLGKIVDDSNPSAAMASPLVPMLVFTTMSFFGLFLETANGKLISRANRVLWISMTGDVVRRILSAPSAYLAKSGADKLIAQTSIASSLQKLAVNILTAGLVNGLLAVGSLFIMVVLSLPIALVALVGVVIKFFVQRLTASGRVAAVERNYSNSLRYRAALLDGFRAAPMLRQYGGISNLESRLHLSASDSANAEYNEASIDRRTTLLVRLVSIADRVFFVTIGAALLAKGMLSAGEFVALGMYRETLVGALDGIRATLWEVDLAKATADRLEPLFMPEASATTEKSFERTSRQIVPVGLSIRDVSFRYGRYSPWLFRGLNLDVGPGESVAIVAPSGTGKSTLAKILCGMIQPSEGSIAIGDIDINTLTGKWATRHIGLVMQSDVLISGSIFDNIDFLRGMNDKEVHAAARLAGAHAFIMRMPMRYRTVVNDATESLSGGERQRVLIARALCGPKIVLIMDESSSSLDIETERLINGRLDSLGITRIMFAHRPETIRSATRVVELHKDRLQVQLAPS